jgi:hypothetical protein
MIVTICLEFNDVDCNSEKADSIIESINSACETMQVGFNASSCWVEDAFNADETGETDES